MIFPSRVASYESSILPKMLVAMKYLSKRSYEPRELFMIMKNDVADVAEFIDVLDCLYILEKIYYNWEDEMIYSVKKHNN